MHGEERRALQTYDVLAVEAIQALQSLPNLLLLIQLAALHSVLKSHDAVCRHSCIAGVLGGAKAGCEAVLTLSACCRGVCTHT